MSASSHATETDGKQDSYLKRYYRTLPEEKRLMIEQSLMNADNGQAHVTGPGHVVAPQDPHKKANEQKNEDSEGNNPKEPKKSSTCIVL